MSSFYLFTFCARFLSILVSEAYFFLDFNQNFCIGSEQETYTENLNLENGIPLPENKENIVQNVFKDLSNEDMLEVDNNMQIYQVSNWFCFD